MFEIGMIPLNENSKEEENRWEFLDLKVQIRIFRV